MAGYMIPLPWGRPPLSANDRIHWRRRAHIVADTRSVAATLARLHHIPASDHCYVTLFWAPPDRRRRDADNLVPTLKALCDGLVDANVVVDDTPEFMTKAMPVIAPAERSPRMWLEVSV